MNEIPKTDAVAQSNWQEDRQNYPESGAGRRNPYIETEKAIASKERSGGDIASILGISASAINAEIKEAVSSLLEQLDFLRKQTQKAVARANYLESQVDLDSLVPFMNTRAFIREFARRIEHGKRVGFKCSLTLFYLADFKDYRQNKGLNFANAVFTKAAVMINSCLKASDTIGIAGFATIGVIMPLLSKIDAQERVEQIITFMKNNPLLINGKNIPINLKFGIYEINEHDTAEKAIDSADCELIKSLKSI